MAGDFGARIDELKALVGEGNLVGQVNVDQVYSHYIHERLDLNHPRGGQAKFLETALYSNASEYMNGIADKVLEGGARDGMVDAVEKLGKHSGELTPKLLTLLAHSDHPKVTDNGAVIYDRSPEVPRLSDAELEELHDVFDHGPLKGLGRHPKRH